jgi:UDP-glucose 4-epimerase
MSIYSSEALKEFYEHKEVLVPGGAGFIGSRLVWRLCGFEARVTVVDPFQEECGGNRFNLNGYQSEIRLVEEKIEYFVASRRVTDYSIIFNCVGLTNHHLGLADPELDYRINCVGGLALLKAICNRRSEAKIISIGTRGQYGKQQTSIEESTPFDPLDIQSVHKCTLEHYHKVFAGGSNIPYVYLRLTNTYGPGQRLRGDGIGFVGELIRNSLKGEEIIIYGNLDRVKNLIYVDDVVDALLLLGLPEARGIYNLGGEACRIADLLDIMRGSIGEIDVDVVPFPESIRNIDTGDAVMDSTKLRSATAWSPKTSIEEGISVTLDYYKKYREQYL